MTQRKLRLEEMQDIARKRGGRCLSASYVNNKTLLRWECAHGHKWRARPDAVKGIGRRRGTWCPVCAVENSRGRGLQEPLRIEEMNDIARRRAGRCLSRSYTNNKTPLLWRCGHGHEWNATPHGVKAGSWCPACARNARLNLQEMRALARKRGGRCLSDEYVNNHAALQWRCRKGHEWTATPGQVKGTAKSPGTWCPECADRTGSLEEMRAIAGSRGGACLSKEYTTSHESLRWRCQHGHEWEALGHSVKRGSWCPVCSGRRPLGLEQMHALARARGGRCLSRKYVNAAAPLRWECQLGHRWRTTPQTVRRGSWCPVCANVKLRKGAQQTVSF